MAKKKTKGKKQKRKPVVVDQKPELKMMDNSFAFCVSNVTGIPTELFNDIDFIMQNAGSKGWHQPYIDVLRHHSYDMIFFSYEEQPLPLGNGVALSDYKLNQLPTGKCVVLGNTGGFEFKAAVGQVGTDFRMEIIYDPDPSREFAVIQQVGFFISTFVAPEAEIDG